MKRIVKNICLLIMIIGLSGCNEEFLDIPVLVNPSPNSIDPATIVTAAYNMNVTGNTDGYPNIRWRNWQTVLQGDAISDDAFKSGSSFTDQFDWREMELFQTGAGNSRISEFWDVQYKKIYVSNWGIDMVKASNLDDQPKNKYLGELYFLRSLNYFWLNRAFGGVTPVFNMGGDPNIKRATEAEIYTQLETDLLLAIENLPDQYDDANLGRATKGAARTLLAKIYLYQNEYQKCFDQCALIIQSGQYELVADFNDIWNRGWTTNNVYEHNKESIFEFVYAPSAEQTNPSDWATAQRPRQPEFGLQLGWGMSVPTIDLLDAFEVGDPRIISTFLFHGDEIVSGLGNFYVNAGFDAGSSNEHYMYSRKVIKPMSQVPIENSYNNGDNFIVFRYAEVLLMYSEAANELGNAAEAMAKLNQVRARARNSSRTDRDDVRAFINFNGEVPGLNRKYLNYDWNQVSNVLPPVTATGKEELRTKIWNERRVEFALEGERFYDLVRQSKVEPNRVGKIMRAFSNKYNNDKGKFFVDGKHEVFPVPQADVDLLGTELMPQNAGY